MERIEEQRDIQVSIPNEISSEQMRTMQQVQGQIILAKKFPRDETAAFNSIVKACKRYSLADVAAYKFPRGDKTVTGPSIRLAEMIAQYWENMEYGWEELERTEGRSRCEAYCWDMQRNLRKVVKFEVLHTMKAKGFMKKLTDPRDIYEHCANQASRRVRACILALIPGDIIEAALDECKKTLAKGDGSQTLEDRIRNLVVRFADVGVTQEMLEKRLGHTMDITTGEEIADLIPIYRVIADGQKKREDFFNIPKERRKASIVEKLEEEERDELSE